MLATMGPAFSFDTAHHLLEQALGRTAEKRFLPMQDGDVPATYADIDALQCDVGFAPHTGIEEGIARFVTWYRDYYRGANPSS